MSKLNEVSSTCVSIGCVVFAALLAAAPAAADWLVLSDGARIETVGPWQERGNLVIFTGTGGGLVSLRLSEVDLVASRDATRETEEAARRPPPPSPPRRSVFSITDADVAHVDAEGDAPTDATRVGADPSSAEEIAVVEWEVEDAPDGGGEVVRGTIANRGRGFANIYSVLVTVFDVLGNEIGATPATVGANGLAPEETTALVAVFPGVFDVSAVRFKIPHQMFESSWDWTDDQ